MGKNVYAVKYLVMLDPVSYEYLKVKNYPQWLRTKGKMIVTAPDIDRAYSDTKQHLEYLYATEGRTIIDITGIKLIHFGCEIDNGDEKINDWKRIDSMD